MKSSVGFLDKKYENVLSQLQLSNERVTNHTTKIKEVQSDLSLANVKEDCRRANIGVGDLAQYTLKGPPNVNYSSNDIVVSIGKVAESSN